MEPHDLAVEYAVTPAQKVNESDEAVLCCTGECICTNINCI